MLRRTQACNSMTHAERKWQTEVLGFWQMCYYLHI
jgi:hypothetical protein